MGVIGLWGGRLTMLSVVSRLRLYRVRGFKVMG